MDIDFFFYSQSKSWFFADDAGRYDYGGFFFCHQEVEQRLSFSFKLVRFLQFSCSDNENLPSPNRRRDEWIYMDLRCASVSLTLKSIKTECLLRV
jgi:hypothetical protein